MTQVYVYISLYINLYLYLYHLFPLIYTASIYYVSLNLKFNQLFYVPHRKNKNVVTDYNNFDCKNEAHKYL